jgi:hypothetical protein
MSEQQPEAPADQCEAKPECEHFYHSLCYRGMSVRICQMCGDPDWDDLAEQLGRKPAPDPLIMPADEFAATRIVAEAVAVVRRGLDLAAPFADDDPRIIAAARTALRVLGGEETDAGPAAAIVETMGPLPVAALDREHVQDLIAAALDESVGRCARCKVCDSQINAVMHAIWPLLEGAGYWHKRWTAALERADEDGMQIISQHVRIGELERRAEAAEAKLAAIERQCGKATEALRRGTGIPLRQQDVMVDARYILEIIGTEGGCDHA